MNLKTVFKFSTETKLKKTINSVKSFKSKKQHKADHFSQAKKITQKNTTDKIQPGVFPLGGLIG